ncbi:STAS domain-containing protein [Xylanibacillus composti]|uniref:STAS domain-containing protein n=1 Tax=Xylanibacillus composti TaxID=1572762 RepID=UPI001FD328D5|nr:STAS domain-containing protein [Xylanibacillus composti]
MKFQVRTEETEQKITIVAEGELDLSTAPKLTEVIGQSVGRTDKLLEMDLGALQYIDSTGLGVMISMLKERDRLNAGVAISNIPPKIKRLFDITGVSRFLGGSRQ